MSQVKRARVAGKKARSRPYLAAPERRRRIIDAAQQVFGRTSLKGATTRNLAKAAKTSQANLFEHFESKDALFQAAVVEPLLAAMRGMSDRARAYEKARSIDELDRLGRGSAEANVELMLRIFPLLSAALFSDLDAGRKLYQQQIAPLLTQRARAIAGITKPTIDPALAELAIFGLHFAVAMDEIFSGRRWERSSLVEQMHILHTAGFVKGFSNSRSLQVDQVIQGQ